LLTCIIVRQYNKTIVMHFFQFIKNLEPQHVSNIICSSSGGTALTWYIACVLCQFAAANRYNMHAIYQVPLV
jgi:hypothetical protein